MTPDEIRSLNEKGYYKDCPVKGELIETHISWIILSEKYAFKIKKPVKFSFLDFSTSDQRQFFCKREVTLNSRFSDIYLSTEPIFFEDGKWVIGGRGVEPIDFTVVMRKMDEHKRMDLMMDSDKVDQVAVTELAKNISRFHLKAERILDPFELTKVKTIFNDILTIEELEEKGYKCGELKSAIRQAIRVSDSFLEKNQEYFQRRIEQGYKRDLHGDLHCGNVFLENPPVIFDCIEFNDEYRQIDVLYDIAFLSMDMESWGRKDLSQLLENTYKKSINVFLTPEDDKLYVYFKCLRANIRAKIYGLRLAQASDDTAKVQFLKVFDRYFSLFKHYVDLLES
ncbi:hypothetical protein SYJ56_19105 [Algoriphagus sp. D3-2-R+10]|uniref:hypothetical protein n=1 Tax=Algoriphagus aurantiacus TaxID=3103948 RepID=UPI002B3B94A7|nr:hypothetical protein [Algoriphagus sp. D3-2-R+10]MEB2777431.1 hypothetical protein [Algoriphagus sp. D3-2-R+10]